MAAKKQTDNIDEAYTALTQGKKVEYVKDIKKFVYEDKLRGRDEK